MTHPVLSMKYSDIVLAVPHLFVHENSALDLYTYNGSSMTVVLNEQDKKFLLSVLKPPLRSSLARGPLMAQRLYGMHPEDVTKMWTDRFISTFDYLLYVNLVGGRSFNDFSQYPVFPWVINDYKNEKGLETLRDLTKPLGAIGETRAQRFVTMYEETGKRYFYGTHYSYPASVFHFLMRSESYTLYNVNPHGGFDHKDRLFCSVEESYRSASETNQADLKEIIPQFFCTDEYLENRNGLPLTTRSDGSDLSNVRLPAWASSPREFMAISRRALESNACAQTLPDWIDLIFGYKQRGQAAIDAMNVFHPLTYEDITPNHDGDISNIKGEIDAINNFGQCPHQIFTSPHPRFVGRKKPVLGQEANIASLRMFVPNVENIEVSREGTVIATKRLQHVIDGLVLAIFDGYYTLGPNMSLFSEALYEVSASAVSKDGVFLATGSRLGVVGIFQYDGQTIVQKQTSIIRRAEFNCIAISSYFEAVFVTTDDSIYGIDITSGYVYAKASIKGIKSVAIDDANFVVYVGCESEVFVLNANLKEICRAECKQLTALCSSDCAVWAENPVFASGHEDGSVLLWTFGSVEGSLSSKRLMKVVASPVSAMSFFNEGAALLCIDETGAAAIAAAPIQLFKVLHPSYFAACPYCLQPLPAQPQTCSVCGLPVCDECHGVNGICSICGAKIETIYNQ